MPLFTWPVPEDVWENLALRPEQIKAPSQIAAVAECAQKIQQEGPSVERRILTATSPQPWPFSDADLATILPKYTALQRTGRQNDQIAQARQAIELMAQHFIRDKAGQKDKAAEAKSDAEMILTGKPDGTGTGGLLGELRDLAESVGEEKPTAPGGSRGTPVFLSLSGVPRTKAGLVWHGDELGGVESIREIYR